MSYQISRYAAPARPKSRFVLAKRMAEALPQGKDPWNLFRVCQKEDCSSLATRMHVLQMVSQSQLLSREWELWSRAGPYSFVKSTQLGSQKEPRCGNAAFAGVIGQLCSQPHACSTWCLLRTWYRPAARDPRVPINKPN